MLIYGVAKLVFSNNITTISQRTVW